MASGGLHSSFVTWLKILLPLLALVILSSLVFLARETEDRREIPFIAAEAPEFARERMTAPEYVTVTDDGSALRITAREAIPAPEDRRTFLAEGVAGVMETQGGRVIHATAPHGRVDTVGDTADLLGRVEIDTSDGFHVVSDNLTARLDTTFLETGGAVHGTAPFGEIEADHMRYGGEGDEADVLVFTGRVRVLYHPGG